MTELKIEIDKKITDEVLIENLLNYKHQSVLNDQQIFFILGIYALGKKMNFRDLNHYINLLEIK